MSFANSTNTTEGLPVCNVAIEAGLIVSYQILEIFQIVNHVILSGAVCLVGMLVNIINMIIFVQQGLDNTVNIGMFAISLSDWCSLVTLEWHNINLNPFMEKADVPFVPAEIQYLTGGWLHACFLHITICITVYVTAERFVCIAFPLKVKQIVTPYRTKVVVTCIYLLMFISVSPMYVLFYFGDNFYTSRNETRVGTRTREVGTNLEDMVYMMAAVIRIVSFIILIILTCMLVITLKKRSGWRIGATIDGEKSKSISVRDSKTMKMVSLIASILIICAAPTMIFSIVAFIETECNMRGKYINVVYIYCSFAFLLEAINSTVNIFFFYKMSTKFRLQFHELFAKCRCFWQRSGVDGREQSSASRGASSVSEGHNKVNSDSENGAKSSSHPAQPE